MFRYLYLWYLFAKFNLVREMEFKGNFIIQLIAAIGWLLVTVFVLEVIFSQTNSIVGWSKGEVYLLYGFYRLTGALHAILFRRNIHTLSHLINSGEFDFYLIKPINITFLASTKYFVFNRISQVVLSLGIVWYAIRIINFPLTLITISFMFFLTLLGTIIRYNISMLLNIPSFWLQKVQNLERLEFTFFGPARFPRVIFPGFIRVLLSLIIPVLFVAAVPAEIILNKAPVYLFPSIIAMALIMSLITFKFFNFALRHYSSASS